VLFAIHLPAQFWQAIRWGRTATCLRPISSFSRSSFSKLPGASRKKLSADESPRTRTKVCTDCATGDDLIIAAGAALALLPRPPAVVSAQLFCCSREQNANLSLITLWETRVCVCVLEINVCLCNAIPADLRFFCSLALGSLSERCIQIREQERDLERPTSSTWHWSLCLRVIETATSVT
jgi:hypothetical protein